MAKSETFHEELNARAESARKCIDFYVETCEKAHDYAWRTKEMLQAEMSDEELIKYTLGKRILEMASGTTRVEYSNSNKYRRVITETCLLDHVYTGHRADNIRRRNEIMKELLPGVPYSEDLMLDAAINANIENIEDARRYLETISEEELRRIALPRLSMFVAGHLINVERAKK